MTDADDLMMASQALGRPRGRWGARLATATALYHLGRQAWQIAERRRQSRSYTVTVLENDEIYGLVLAWVLDRMPTSDQRALVARTSPVRRNDGPVKPMDVDDKPPAREVMLGFDGSRSQRISVDGYVVMVRVEREDDSGSPGEGSSMYKPRKVVFEAPDLQARHAVVGFLQAIADSISDSTRPPRLIAATRWGDWRVVRDLPPRPLSTVVLPEGHLDAVTADLTTFLGSEQRYLQLGIPWHRGYLFWGPPGTGKTSTARALAASLGLDVYFLTLSDLDKDVGLHQLLGQVPPRTVLLLEDIDVTHAATDRDDDRRGVTLAGLLNALDGVVTPHGMVVMMTTNNRASLDPALIRPGRVDHEIEMTWLTPEQFGRLVEALTDRPCRLWEHFDADLGAGVPFPRITAAEVVGVIAERMHDPDAAVAAALALLDARGDDELRSTVGAPKAMAATGRR